MKTICPHCNYEYPDIDNNLLDQEVECFNCKEIFVVEHIKFDRQIDIKPQKAHNPKLTNCSACGNTVSKTALICPHCGQKIAIGKCRNAKLGWLFFLIAVICGGLCYIGGTIFDRSGENTLLACGIVGLIISLSMMAVFFTSPHGR